MISPINGQQAVPFAACRVRAVGVGADDLTVMLDKAVRSGGDGKGTGEVLMLSNIWLAA